ncbi:hypothetical protein ACFO6R_16160 [Eubacterium multiforme]|uniref:Uncharacterized protein n=1 Tax=Eubacterium multiforme TaxID=83339 RepID=A0ABT9UTD8_9FIRM|nr:hypothetical protein [Eubacterium multiforme]MDQ0149602.1 hypothetical protein [Eubacterium multiforme]
MEIQMKKRYRINFSDEELLKLNKILNENKRKKAMSVLQYIIKYCDEKSGFLELSLDRLYEKFKRYHKEISLTYFKKLSETLVELRLLAIKKIGRLKFFGRKILNKIKNNKEENKENIEEYKVKNKYEKLKKNNVKEKKSKDEFKVASKENVIEVAYEIMNEAGIKTGSRTYFQVIESLYYILDKKDIHINGMVKYIEKVVEDKVRKQGLFKANLIALRNKVYKTINFNNFTQRKRSSKEWRNIEMKLLGWDDREE